jgi:NitT/TauT family transport system ATP-binding protein
MNQQLLLKLEVNQSKKIYIRNISKWLKGKSGVVHVLDNVTLSIKEGEFVCFLGPSGCGKTSLLNLIAGLIAPDIGTIFVDGIPIREPSSDRMVMFQESALFPWLNVLGNVLFGLDIKHILSKKEKKERALYYLKLVGMERFIDAHIHELSGGMKQRVALARALAPDPQVLLMDEPFAALDAITREQLYGDIQEICQKSNKTIIFVTHNVAEAVCLGDRVVLFSPNPGRNHEEFIIDLPRSRDIRSLDVARHAEEITRILRNYIQLK